MSVITDDITVFIVIICSAAVTYGLRIGGLLLGGSAPLWMHVPEPCWYPLLPRVLPLQGSGAVLLRCARRFVPIKPVTCFWP